MLICVWIWNPEIITLLDPFFFVCRQFQLNFSRNVNEVFPIQPTQTSQAVSLLKHLESSLCIFSIFWIFCSTFNIKYLPTVNSFWNSKSNYKKGSLEELMEGLCGFMKLLRLFFKNIFKINLFSHLEFKGHSNRA